MKILRLCNLSLLFQQNEFVVLALAAVTDGPELEIRKWITDS